MDSVLSNPIFLGMHLKETTEGMGKDDLWIISQDVQLQIICDCEDATIKLNFQQ